MCLIFTLGDDFTHFEYGIAEQESNGFMGVLKEPYNLIFITFQINM